MGGLAVVVDWERPVSARDLDPMLALTPHRATGGTRRIAFEQAAMAETFFTQDAPGDPAVTSIGHLSIVGDLRLWNRDDLKARAGGNRVTAGMDDRRLLLTAYQRTGIDFLDDVDGDFAFVIWDNRDQRVIAVRDRFGVKPLFFERTPTGIRFASEVKQLVATSARPVGPNDRSVIEYLTGRYTETRFTFFEGVERVRPSTTFITDPSGERVHRYWDPNPETVPAPPAGDVADGFREHLVDSVRRRLETSDVALSHLTGGLDSSSITVSAQLLAGRSGSTPSLHTVSAIFPGYDNDESVWIDEIAHSQPFPHHDFVPRVEDIAEIKDDMWRSDSPCPVWIGDIWGATASTASAVGADLVITGMGGDEVLDQYHLLADLLRSRRFGRWASETRRYSSWSGRSRSSVVSEAVRGALPTSFKHAVRSLIPRRRIPDRMTLRPEVWDRLQGVAVEQNPTDLGFPSLTQNLTVSYTRAPRLVALLEYDESQYAFDGLGSTHPFLDRALVEYVASIPVVDRPVDGRTKTLVRQSFQGLLPQSVLDRRTKTVADSYIVAVFAQQFPRFRSRFPRVTPAGAAWLDSTRYRDDLNSVDTGDADATTRESLWTAWMVMAWLDGLERYQRE